MAVLEALKKDAQGRRGYKVSNPATLELIGEFRVETLEDVQARVKRARLAQREWAKRSVQERVAVIQTTLDLMIERQEAILDVICADTGRGRTESLLMEIIPAADAMAWHARRAPGALADKKVGTQTLLKTKKMVITHRPLGVLGVIAPWNGPFILGIASAVPALLAGNAVIIKPSEITPFSGSIIEQLFRDAGLPADVLQIAKGDGETGAALVEAGVDKLTFTGSTKTGRKVGEAAGRNLIEFTLELGGKDASIVCRDADLDRAARGVVYGRMFNTGQFCCATERVYVVREVADAFIEKAVAYAKELRQGTDGEQDVSAMIWPNQMDILEEQVADAVKKGAKILLGGGRNKALQGAAFEPTILTDVNHSMLVMTEENFGPLLPIMVVEDEDEALALANDSPFGLSGTVWTKNNKKGMALAKAMETGSVCVNESSLTFGIHRAPFGGAKNSGVGFVHGENGILQYCRQVPVIFDRLGLKEEQNWYPLTEKKRDDMSKFIKFFYGSRIFRKLA